MFWIVPVPRLADTLSSSATSDALRRHPSAPRLDCACAKQKSFNLCSTMAEDPRKIGNCLKLHGAMVGFPHKAGICSGPGTMVGAPNLFP
eukprot:scaffold235579_cov17-Tisochrysis_lutea.AAC.1